MTDASSSTEAQHMPAWLNSLMRVLLRTPGIQRLIGRSLALLTFHGRRTGRRYTIPVSYQRDNGTVIMLSNASRVWWHNFEQPAPVELTLAGRQLSGTAQARIGTEDDLETVTRFLEARPIDARAHGVQLGRKRKLAEADARALLPRVAVIRTELS